MDGTTSRRSVPARGLALGCALGLAVGAAASWLRFALTGTLVLDTGSPAYLVAALLLGGGLALSGVCALRLARKASALEPRTLLGLAVLVQLCAFPALALTSRDLFSNLAYGELQRLGLNPYLHGPRAAGPELLRDLVAPRWLDTPTAYGPILSALGRLAAAAGAALGSPVWGAGAAFKLAMVLCSLATLLLAKGALERRGGEGREGFVLLAFGPLLAWEVSGQAHNDGVLVLALMAFVFAAERGRELPAVLALALGVVSKVAAAPLLVFYLLLIYRRSPGRALLLGLAAAALCALAFAPYWHGLASLRGPGATLGGDVHRHAHSLADLLGLVLEPFAPRAAAVAYRLCWVGSLMACAAVFVRALLRARSLEGIVHEALALLLVYCLTVPWFQPWYATWMLPLLAVERAPGFRRLVGVYTVLTVVQWALPLDPVSTVAVNVWTAIAWRRLPHRPPEPGPAPA
ncbi:MAG TPA: hypothetical protein VMG32_10040 [Anaeromyxobacteraceae bacterium]|nr:hypothetical protein [Anaeromyxobacteraceae bacterium]